MVYPATEDLEKKILLKSFSVIFPLILFYFIFLKFFSVFANDPGDRGSIPGRVIPKTQKIVLDAALLNTQYYKIRIKVKVEQSSEWSSALPYTSVK